jgi:UDP-N-acetyl-D-mannosaminuronic acid dehydrogenase
MAARYRHDIGIYGGAGHIGAALAIVCAARGLRTLVYDIDRAAMTALADGRMPFLEEGGDPLLREALDRGSLSFTDHVADLGSCEAIVITIGTPVDEFHNPSLGVVTRCVDELLPHLSDDQLIVLRSTVFPGVTEHVHRYLGRRGKRTLVAFCPERAVEGRAVREIQTLPQIVSGTTDAAEERAAKLFDRIAPETVRMVPKEAEFAKLFANAYRYIQFSAANQFFMMVEDAGLNYHRLMAGLKRDYPRIADLPTPGFAAGPCLFKDTLQLAAGSNDHFGLGHAAIQVNEGLPAFLAERLLERFPLKEMTVGLLGMAFKSDSDDTRASLSYKMKKLLRLHAREVLTTDPLVRDDAELMPLDEVLDRSDLLVLCVPHSAYRGIDVRGKPVVDLWGALGTERPIPANDGVKTFERQFR